MIPFLSRANDAVDRVVGYPIDLAWDLVATPLHKVGRWTHIALHPLKTIQEKVQSSPNPLLKEALSAVVQLKRAIDEKDEKQLPALREKAASAIDELLKERSGTVYVTRLSAAEQRNLHLLARACRRGDTLYGLDEALKGLQYHYEGHTGLLNEVLDTVLNVDSPSHVKATKAAIGIIDQAISLLARTAGEEDQETLAELQKKITLVESQNPELSAIDLLKKMPELSSKFTVNGRLLPDLSISKDRDVSAAPEILAMIDQHEKVLGRANQVDSEIEIDYEQKIGEQQEQFIENASLFTTVKIVWGHFCGKKTDNEFFVEALNQAREVSKAENVPLKRAMRAVIYHKIDAAKNLSSFTKLFSKFIYWIVSATSYFFIESFTTSIVKEMQNYIYKSSKEGYTPIANLFVDNMGKYLTSLTAIYNRQAHLYKNPSPTERITGSLPQMISKELTDPAYLNGLTEAELYGKVTHDIVRDFSPKVRITKTIQKFFQKIKDRFHNSSFVSVPLDIISLSAQLFVAIPQLIINGFLSMGLRLFIERTNLIPSLVDNTVEAIRDQNGYSHALNKLIYIQLQDLYKILQIQKNEEDLHDPATIEAEDLLSPFSEVHKNKLATFIDNLFQVLDLEDCSTHENLYRFLHSRTIRQQYDELLDAIAIQDVIRASAEVVSIAFTSLMQKEQLSKQLFNFMWLANNTFERNHAIEPKEFKTVENGILDTMNSILNISIDKALQEKFDMTGQVQERTIRRAANVVSKETERFTNAIDSLLIEAEGEIDDPKKTKKIVEKMIEEAISFERNLISMKVKWEGSQLLSDSIIRELNGALLKLTHVYKLLSPLLDAFYRNNHEFLSLTELNQQGNSLLSKPYFTIQECSDIQELLVVHMTSFVKEPSLFLLLKESLYRLIIILKGEKAVTLFDELQELRISQLNGKAYGKATELLQRIKEIEDADLKSSLGSLVQRILELKSSDAIHDFEDTIALEKKKVEDLLFQKREKLTADVKEGLKRLSSIVHNDGTSRDEISQEELNQAQIQEIREACTNLKEFQKTFKVTSPVNIPIAPNAIMDFSKALVFNRTQKRLSNLVKFVTTPTHYKHGLWINTLMLPYIGAGVKA